MLATYLLAKGHHHGVRIQAGIDSGVSDRESGIYWPVEFEAANNIGTPCALMSQVPNLGVQGTEEGVFIREHSGGVSLVNASRTVAYTVALPNGTYKDLYNNSVSSPLTVQPLNGVVLLKTSAAVCNGSSADQTPPAITLGQPTNITQTTASINWTTNEPADGQVEFLGVCPSTGCLTGLVTALSTSHTIPVSGLASNTVYTFRVRSKDASGNLGISSNSNFMTSIAPDTTPPAIFSVSLTGVTTSAGTINWSTNEPADGQVEFVNLCPPAGCLTSLVTTLSTSHSISVSGLVPNTAYTSAYYRKMPQAISEYQGTRL